jgi:hypothetical protein
MGTRILQKRENEARVRSESTRRELNCRSGWRLSNIDVPSLRGASPSEERSSLERLSLQQYVVEYVEP